MESIDDLRGHQNEFATLLTEKSFGGLVICGTNWGAGGGASGDTSESGHAPGLFWNRPYSYPYQRELKAWLEFWGYDLAQRPPPKLDHAISQTNFFLDSTKTFRQRDSFDWGSAIERLSGALGALRPSGVIFCSINAMGRAFSEAERQSIESWNNLMGQPQRWETHSLGSSFSLQFVRDTGSNISVVGMKHPSGRGTIHEEVKKAADVMKPWLDLVMRKYETKQSEIRHRL